MKRLITTIIRTLISFKHSLFLSSNPPPSLPTLSFDLIAEMLPVNLLLQLRCLNKTLNSLIAYPDFSKIHLRKSTTHHHLILIEPSNLDAIKVISYPLHSFFKPKTINPPNYTILPIL
jgi:hypothetical protein